MKLFRRAAVVILAIFALAALAILWLGKNGFVEQLTEQTLEDMFKAKVEIDGLDFDLSTLTIAIDHMAVADQRQPMRNIVELGPSRFGIELMPLFARKVIVHQMTVSQMTFDTPRQTSGAIPRPTINEAPSDSDAAGNDWASEFKSAMGSVDLPKADFSALGAEFGVDRLIDPDKLQSLQQYREASAEVHRLTTAWRSRMEKTDLQSRTAQISSQLKQLEQVDSKDLKAVKKALTELKEIQQEIKSVITETEELRADFDTDITSVKAAVGEVDRLLDEDIAAVSRLANIGDMNLEQAGRLLFGNVVAERIETILGYLSLARSYLPSSEASETLQPARRRGQVISFPATNPVLPAFLLREARFDGSLADGSHVAGRIADVSSSARILGKPVVLNASLSQAGAPSWIITGTFDHREETPREHLTISGDELRLGRIGLGGDGRFLPTALLPGHSSASIVVAINGNSLNADLEVAANNSQFQFSGSDESDRTARAMREGFSAVDRVTLSGEISGELGRPRLVVTSNLDKVLGDRFNAALNARRKEVEQQVRQAVSARVAGERAAYDKQMRDLRQPVDSRIAAVSATVTEQQATLAEQQRRVEQQIKASEKRLQKQVNEVLNKNTKSLSDKLKEKLGR